MTKIIRVSLYLFFICILFSGCGNDQDFVAGTGPGTFSSSGGPGGSTGTTGDTSDPGDPSDAAAELPRIDAQLVMPNGVRMDMSSLSVMSVLDVSPVDSNGGTRVVLEEGGQVLAVVFDSEDHPILASFITDTQTEISVKTTVKTSLFIGMGTVLLSDEIKELFWQNVESFPGFEQLVSQAETMFGNDPRFFESSAYRDLIRSYIASLTGSGILPRLVTEGTIKSGLQVKEVGGDAVVIVNTFRRRAHAFVYKLKVTDSETDKETILIPDSAFSNGASVPSTNSFIVSATAAATSFFGTLQGGTSGKGLEFAAKDSDPVDLSLNQGEKKATYAIRVVGPSFRPDTLVQAEQEILSELEIETLALDFVMPVLLNALGTDGEIAGKVSALKTAGASFTSIFKQVLAAAPGATENLKKGEYEQAASDIFQGIIDGRLADLFEPFVNETIMLVQQAYQGTGKTLGKGEAARIAGAAGNMVKFIEALDILLQAADWTLISKHALNSKMVEEFRVDVTTNKVTLTPPTAAVMEGSAKSVKATIQDGTTTLGEGEAFVYKWSTSGNYGSLRDNVGNSGTSFESSRDTVEYVAAAGNFPADASDEIWCEVSIKGPGPDVPVGEADPIMFRVRPREYRIDPKDPIVQGGDVITLEARFSNGSNPQNSDAYEFQFVWFTPGEYGMFDGTNANFSSETSNQANYECLELEKEGLEVVELAVYSRLKDGDGPYQFDDMISTNIEIDQDPNKKIFFVRNSTIQWKTDGAVYYNGGVQTVYAVEPIDYALNYRITVVAQTPDAIPSYVGGSSYFQATDPTTDGVYRHVSSRYSTSKLSPESRDEAVAARFASQSGYYGKARVVVNLDPNRPVP